MIDIGHAVIFFVCLVCAYFIGYLVGVLRERMRIDDLNTEQTMHDALMETIRKIYNLRYEVENILKEIKRTKEDGE